VRPALLGESALAVTVGEVLAAVVVVVMVLVAE